MRNVVARPAPSRAGSGSVSRTRAASGEAPDGGAQRDDGDEQLPQQRGRSGEQDFFSLRRCVALVGAFLVRVPLRRRVALVGAFSVRAVGGLPWIFLTEA